jgi:Arsenical resistance operon protein ArsD
MKTIQVYDPALCCSTGVCGVDVDQALVTFSADVEWARQQGARIERFNLAQQPMAFAENITVKGILERAGQEALPVTLVGGELALAGRYPTRADLARWAGVASPTAQVAAASGCAPARAPEPKVESGCCTGGNCC